MTLSCNNLERISARGTTILLLKVSKILLDNNLLFIGEQLVVSIVNLFIGGTETIATTMRWAIVFLIENPDVQEKVFQEIQSVVGTARDVTLEDRGKQEKKKGGDGGAGVGNSVCIDPDEG